MVVVVVETTGAGVVVVVCSDVVDRLYGAGPQPDKIARPAISARLVAARTIDGVLLMAENPLRSGLEGGGRSVQCVLVCVVFTVVETVAAGVVVCSVVTVVSLADDGAR